MQDAAEKKQQYMEAQNAARNAQSVASDTKFESDKLQQELEKAEIEAASAASMIDVPQTNSGAANPMAAETHNPVPKQAYESTPYGNGPMGGAAPPTGGYPADAASMGGYGSSAAEVNAAPMGDYGGGAAHMGGYGGDGGYGNNGVMGGGGFAIPTPTANVGATDGYGFGSPMGGASTGNGAAGQMPPPPQNNSANAYANPF